MQLEQRVAQEFARNIDTTRLAAEQLAGPIAHGADRIVQALLGGGKVIGCGNGGSSGAAQQFMTKMVNRFDRDRPGLPAIAISSTSSTMSSVADESSFEHVFSQQINALGQPGDVLLTISCTGESPNMLQAAYAAHDRQMTVVALSGRGGGQLSGVLWEHDVEIRVPSDSVARIQEIHLLIIHCLCDLIDVQLLGD